MNGPGRLAGQAVDAIRTLNQQALDGQVPGSPQDARDITGSLQALASQLAQLADQLSMFLQHEQAAPRITRRRGAGPDPRVRAAQSGLDRSTLWASLLEGSLADAHNALAQLTAAE
jgi:hypothetical protein